MKSRLHVLALACSLLATPHASAQLSPLPDSISGRWTWVQRAVSQTFSVDQIKARPDRAFTARLTWWTIDPKCMMRDVPITGRQTDGGITFESATPCNVAFRVDLQRAPAGWTGTATTTGGNVLVLELKAD